MKKRGMNQKAQTMSMPFTLIFSIILVAIVIFVGFYVIRMFLNTKDQVVLNSLPAEITNKVMQIYSQGDESSERVEFSCKEGMSICFVNFTMAKKGADSGKFDELKDWDAGEKNNFFYYPLGSAEDFKSSTSWNIKCGEKSCIQIRASENPLCFECNGKVAFTLVKESGKSLVYIER